MKTTLKFDRETKGTNVYKNDEDGAPIPSLYVKKTAFKKGEPPKTLTLEIAELK